MNACVILLVVVLGWIVIAAIKSLKIVVRTCKKEVIVLWCRSWAQKVGQTSVPTETYMLSIILSNRALLRSARSLSPNRLCPNEGGTE